MCLDPFGIKISTFNFFLIMSNYSESSNSMRFCPKIFACYLKPRYLRTQKTMLFETTTPVEFKNHAIFFTTSNILGPKSEPRYSETALFESTLFKDLLYRLRWSGPKMKFCVHICNQSFYYYCCWHHLLDIFLYDFSSPSYKQKLNL